MAETFGTIFDKVLGAPTGSVLVIAGILFLLIAVIGNISGRIEPGTIGRMAAGVIGLALLAGGLTAFQRSAYRAAGARDPGAKTDSGRPAAAGSDPTRGSGCNGCFRAATRSTGSR